MKTNKFFHSSRKYNRNKIYLGLHFFLTVAEVVIGKDGYHNTSLVTEGNLERGAIVVQFVILLPAHSRSLLFFCCIINVGKAEILLLQLTNVCMPRRELKEHVSLQGIISNYQHEVVSLTHEGQG